MKEFQSQKIKSALRDLLKKNKITYEDVAEKLECSVPTVKRILGPEELTLSRLLELCDLLSINLGDLQTLIGEEKSEEEKFTPAQENFLVKNSSYFAYLMKLFDSKTPKQIAETYGLNQRSNDKYLIGLEKNELIKVTGAGKVKPAFKGMPSLGQGALAKAYFKSFIQVGAEFFIRFIHESLSGISSDKKDGKKDPANFSIWGTKMSRETYMQWTEDQNKLFQELQRRAAYEEKTRKPEEMMTAVIISAFTLVKNDYHGLESLDNVFGKIENL